MLDASLFRNEKLSSSIQARQQNVDICPELFPLQILVWWSNFSLDSFS